MNAAPLVAVSAVSTLVDHFHALASLASTYPNQQELVTVKIKFLLDFFYLL